MTTMKICCGHLAIPTGLPGKFLTTPSSRHQPPAAQLASVHGSSSCSFLYIRTLSKRHRRPAFERCGLCYTTSRSIDTAKSRSCKKKRETSRLGAVLSASSWPGVRSFWQKGLLTRFFIAFIFIISRVPFALPYQSGCGGSARNAQPRNVF